MPRRLLLVLATCTAAFLVGAADAVACACCSDKGTWYEQAAGLKSYERSELARLRFAPTAFDVPSPEGRNGSYRVTARLTGASWRIQLSGLPALSFKPPARAISFAADLYDGKQGSAGGPLLYKELRLAGSSTGPGTRYRLILQGRGNNCLAAEDFTHWRLEVTGGAKKLAVYGSFRRPA